MRKIALFAVIMTVFFLAEACHGAAERTITKDMAPVLKEAKTRLNEWFKILNNDLSNAAERLSTMDLKSKDARDILKELMIGRSSIIDGGIVDASGTLVAIQPAEYSSYEGTDLSNQRHVKEVIETKRPVMSAAFLSVEKVDSIAMEYPIFSETGQFRGSVSLIIKYALYFDYILGKIVRDLPCKIWIMQTDGLVLYDPDPNQINKNIFTDDMFRPFTGLITFSKKVISEKNGMGSYDFYAKGYEDKTVVKKDALWDTVGMYGGEVRVIVMEIER